MGRAGPADHAGDFLPPALVQVLLTESGALVWCPDILFTVYNMPPLPVHAHLLGEQTCHCRVNLRPACHSSFSPGAQLG